MTSLALLTPWPPQHSGIADYAFDLASMLIRPGLEIVVFTSEVAPRALAGVELRTVGQDQDFDVLGQFDIIIYQLGNNTLFHLWMMPLLTRYPGVIHLHDLVMHHIAAWQTWGQGDVTAYLDLLDKWYGPQLRQQEATAINEQNYLWESERVTQFPLSEEFLQDASAVIVHSNFALEHVRKTAPRVPSFVLPQLYCIEARPPTVVQLTTIAVLGGVDPQKRVDWVIRALAEVADTNHPLQLNIVGSVDPRCEHLYQLARSMDTPGLEIIFHGRVDERAFSRVFQRADLCIALRYPTMGETSAIVMKALQYGIPTVVSDVGWYAELPDDIVKKVPVAQCQQALTTLLDYLLQDAVAFENWTRHCAAYAMTAFPTDEFSRCYIDICDHPRGIEMVTDILAEVLREVGLQGEDEEDQILDSILSDSCF